MKRCTCCRQEKPLDEFGKNARTPTGRHGFCRVCVNRVGRNNRQAAMRRDPDGERAKRSAKTTRQRARQRARDKALVFAHYGEECACCRTTERPTIDHIDGQGSRHRMELFGRPKGRSGAFYRWLVRNDFPEGFQALCARCNGSKGTSEACRLDHDAPPGLQRRRSNPAPRPGRTDTDRPTCPTCGHIVSHAQAQEIFKARPSQDLRS